MRISELQKWKGMRKLFHFSVKIINRRRQRILAAAAYRSGERLYDCKHKCFHNFTRKKGVVYREILLPKNAPKQFHNRELLWNTVESAEKRKDARLAREAEFALPCECNLEEQIALARSFVLENFVALGMCADLCIHHRDKNNPHAHVLLTDRPISESGFAKKKDSRWNEKNLIFTWRESWANNLNREYARKGLEKRVTHESFKTRGITDRKPTKHLGRRVLEYAARGQETDRMRKHLEILQFNHADAEREKILTLLRHNREREMEMERSFERSR